MRINVVASLKASKYAPGKFLARVEVWQNAQMIEVLEKTFKRLAAAKSFIKRVSQDAYDRLEAKD